MPEPDVFVRRIPEQVVPGRRLGRHVAHDPRSRDYPADRAPAVRNVLHTAVGLPLDQGALGSCTANALCGALNSAPDHPAGGHVYTEDDARACYHAETTLEGDPWPPNDPGGSGLMVCKAGRQLGWLASYRHAFGTQHALEALVLRPVIIGIAWLSSFDTPDPKTGVVEWAAGATVRGGHEVVLDEINLDLGPEPVVGAWQSWGAWGVGGRFYIPASVLDRLLHFADFPGDVTVPVPKTP